MAEGLAEAPEAETPEEAAARLAQAAAAGRGGAQAAGTAARVLSGPALKAARVGAVTAIVAAFLAFLREHRRSTRRWLYGELLKRRTGVASGGTPTEGGRPLAGPDPAVMDDVGRVMQEEEDRAEEFARKQAQRVARKTTAAVAIEDAKDRERALDGIMRREKFIVRQRQEAMASRAFAAIDREVLRRASPNGAFWKLDPNVREHTIGCLILGGKFWPWAVLDRVYPPRHPGCPCRLISYHEAVASGLLAPGAVRDVRDAVKAAAHVVMEGQVEPQEHEVEGFRALVFEAHLMEQEDRLIEAGHLQLAEVEVAHGSVVLQQRKPPHLRELMESVGLGRDASGWFVYGARSRSTSAADPSAITQVQIEAAVGPQGE